MKTIVVKNSDSEIWNLDDVVIETMQAIQNNEDILYDMLVEGCCVESLGLYRVLDKICNLTKFDPARITIKVCNLKESHPKYNIQKYLAGSWLINTRKKARPDIKIINNNTKHFGHFVGHGNRFRLIIASYLFTNYQSKTLQTYHCDVLNEYHREFIALEDILFYNHGHHTFAIASDFIQHTPLTLDNIVNYPINGEKLTDLLDAYQDIFIDIIPQSYYTGNVFQLDEKFWRPIATKTPFIVQGPQQFINNIRAIGFKTFDRWWDEGYSEDPIDYQIKSILNIIDTISKWSTEQLADVYQEMLPILEHNYNLFMELSLKDIESIQYK